MMNKNALEEEALDWVIRLGDPGFADWDALTAWLAVSPDHARVFNALQLAEADVLEDIAEEAPDTSPIAVEPVQPVANDNPSQARRFWPMGLVAGVAALVAVGLWWASAREDAGAPWQEYRTADGVRRELRLADGTQVCMNGGTVLRVDPSGRGAQLLSGEALFEVRHDAAHPFTVTAGEATITDLGTRFDVTSADGRVTVGVAEGSVALAGKGEERVELTAGQGGELSGSRLRAFEVAPGSVAAWTEGRLSYEDAPVEQVMADVRRATGLRLTPGPVAGRRFTGTIGLDGPPEALRAKLVLLLGAAEEEGTAN